MGNREILLEALPGWREIAVFDELRPNDFIIKTLEYCEPFIERAKMLSELNPGEDFRHVAVIPQSVLDRSHREGWFNDREKWSEWANDSANSKLRTWPGRI